MSKYTEAIEVLKRNKPTSDPRECGRELCNAVDVAIKALQIADRLEQADVEEAKNIYCQELSCAGLCDECDHLEDFADGYNKALADIRGDEDD